MIDILSHEASPEQLATKRMRNEGRDFEILTLFGIENEELLYVNCAAILLFWRIKWIEYCDQMVNLKELGTSLVFILTCFMNANLYS